MTANEETCPEKLLRNVLKEGEPFIEKATGASRMIFRTISLCIIC